MNVIILYTQLEDMQHLNNCQFRQMGGFFFFLSVTVAELHNIDLTDVGLNLCTSKERKSCILRREPPIQTGEVSTRNLNLAR